MADALTEEQVQELVADASKQRLEKLGAVAADPETHGWPDRFLAPGRTKRGEVGVPLKDFANALGCNSQALRHQIGPPLGVVAVGSKPVDVFDPALLAELATNPKVIASRNSRAQGLKDPERLEVLTEAFDELTDFVLKQVRVRSFRSIDDTTVPLGGLTVLVGRNGAGKSSLLHAIASSLQVHTGVEPSDRPGEVQFALSAASHADTAPAHRLAAYLAIGESLATASLVIPLIDRLVREPILLGGPGRWSVAVSRASDGAASSTIEAHLRSEEVKSRLLHDLLTAVLETDVDELVPVRRLQVEGPRIAATIIGGDTSALGDRLFDEIPAAARTHFFAWNSTDDFEDDSDLEPAVAVGDAVTAVGLQWLNSAGAPCATGEATAVSVEVARRSGVSSRTASTSDVVALRELILELEDLSDESADAQVEQRLYEITVVLAGLSGLMSVVGDTADWFSPDDAKRIRAMACLRVVESLANRIAPTFVRQAGRILLLRPQHPGTQTVGIALLTTHGTVVDLTVLSSGLQRWVAVLVDFAMSRAGDFFQTFDRDHELGGLEAGDDVAAAASLAGQVLGQPPTTRTSLQLLLADEPELHLHPAAQEDVARWALQTAELNQVILATHAPAFLQLSPAEGSLIRVAVDDFGATRAQRLEGDFLNRLDAVADDLGLGREWLLQLLRGLVVVEGQADAEVLRRFAQPIIDRYRIAIVPIGGHSRSKSLADGDLAAAIGLPIAVLFDETSDSALRIYQEDRRAKVPDEIKSLARILQLRDHGLRCDPIFFDAPDIVAAIPDATVRRRFPGFESWDATMDSWRADGSVSFKNFVLDSWNVKRTKDLEVISELAADRRPDEELPQSIQRSIAELTAWAESLGVAQPLR